MTSNLTMQRINETCCLVFFKYMCHCILTSIATAHFILCRILESVLKDNDLPGSVCSMICGGADIGWAKFCKTRMHSSRMRTARSLIVSPYLVVSHTPPRATTHAPPESNHACPPGATMHAPPGPTMHAPQSNHAHPPGATTHPPTATTHAPQSNHTPLPLGQPCMPPRATMHTPLEQPRTPPQQPRMPPRATTHPSPWGNHACPPCGQTDTCKNNLRKLRLRVVTRQHSIRMRNARLPTVQGGAQLCTPPATHVPSPAAIAPPPLWTEWQTGVKTLPCPKLHLWVASRKYSSRMHTTHLPTIGAFVATRCQYWWRQGDVVLKWPHLNRSPVMATRCH